MVTNEQIAVEIIGGLGRMIGGSKSRYRHENPNNFVIFNANICTKRQKIWYGDLDITLDQGKLITLAEELGEPIYVLYEMDGRFENEGKPKIENAALIVDCYPGNLTLALREDLQPYFARGKNGIIQARPDHETPKHEPVPREKIVYDRAEYVHEVTLPPGPTLFTSGKKEGTPYQKFALFIAEQLGGLPAGHTMRMGAITVSKEYEEALAKVVKAWIRKQPGIVDDFDADQNLLWHRLDLSPSTFEDQPEWANAGKAYIKADFFIKSGE